MNRRILPDYQVIPQPIADYISHDASDTRWQGNKTLIYLKLPSHKDQLKYMGFVTPDDNNPLDRSSRKIITYTNVTLAHSSLRRVQASAQNEAEYLPLPDALIPGQLVPNRNLLGYEPTDIYLKC